MVRSPMFPVATSMPMDQSSVMLLEVWFVPSPIIQRSLVPLYGPLRVCPAPSSVMCSFCMMIPLASMSAVRV